MRVYPRLLLCVLNLAVTVNCFGLSYSECAAFPSATIVEDNSLAAIFTAHFQNGSKTGYGSLSWESSPQKNNVYVNVNVSDDVGIVPILFQNNMIPYQLADDLVIDDYGNELQVGKIFTIPAISYRYCLLGHGPLTVANSALEIKSKTSGWVNVPLASEELKSEELKSEELKSEELKSEELKSEELK